MSAAAPPSAMPASGAGRVVPSISQPTGSMCGPIVQSR
jgi:hypothetical protein